MKSTAVPTRFPTHPLHKEPAVQTPKAPHKVRLSIKTNTNQDDDLPLIKLHHTVFFYIFPVLYIILYFFSYKYSFLVQYLSVCGFQERIELCSLLKHRLKLRFMHVNYIQAYILLQISLMFQFTFYIYRNSISTGLRREFKKNTFVHGKVS